MFNEAKEMFDSFDDNILNNEEILKIKNYLKILHQKIVICLMKI